MSTLPVSTAQTALVAADEDLITEWLEHCRLVDNASADTILAYEKGMEIFESWLIETEQFGRVTPEVVVAFKAELLEEYSAQTVNLRLSAVRSFYRWAVNTGKIESSPASSVKGAKRSSSRRHKRDALTAAEVRAVLATCDDTPVGVRDLAILSLMAYCGLREVEIHRANLENLRTQGERMVLEVQGKGRVEPDEIAVIPAAAEPAVRAWAAHRAKLPGLGEKTDPLFCSLSPASHGTRLGRRAIRAIVKDRFREAGVVGQRKSTHSLRHSAITQAIRAGATPMQVQAMARHASYDTTLGYFHEEARTTNPAEDLIEY